MRKPIPRKKKSPVRQRRADLRKQVIRFDGQFATAFMAKDDKAMDDITQQAYPIREEFWRLTLKLGLY